MIFDFQALKTHIDVGSYGLNRHVSYQIPSSHIIYLVVDTSKVAVSIKFEFLSKVLLDDKVEEF